jgi:hypothetical protein
MAAKVTPVYVMLALDPVQQKIGVLGFHRKRYLALRQAEARRTEFSPDACYHTVIDVASDNLGPELHRWARSCGIPSELASQMVRDLGEVLLELFAPHEHVAENAVI